MNPGENVDFFFSFISKNSGIYSEQYIFSFEPRANIEFPVITLTGNALVEDELKTLREALIQTFKEQKNQYQINELIQDITDGIKTPTPPLPDLDDPEVRK